MTKQDFGPVLLCSLTQSALMPCAGSFPDKLLSTSAPQSARGLAANASGVDEVTYLQKTIISRIM